MIIYISGWLGISLLFGLLCFAITKVKRWDSSTCWRSALGGFLLGPIWLIANAFKPKCIGNKQYRDADSLSMPEDRYVLILLIGALIGCGGIVLIKAGHPAIGAVTDAIGCIILLILAIVQ